MVSINRWSIDNHAKIVHWLASTGTGPRNRRHARYLSNHPPILGSPGDEIGKTIPTQSAQRIYPVAPVLESITCPPLPFHVTMSSRDVWVEALLNIRCIIKGYIIFAVMRWTSVRCSVQTRRGENGSFCRYRSTDYVSLRKTKEINNRQKTKQLQIKTNPKWPKHNAFQYQMQLYPGERVESCEPSWKLGYLQSELG